MSDDKELNARLRKADEYEPLGHDGWEAADRIEALTKERDDAVVKRAAWELEARTLTAKLAKVVEVLEGALRYNSAMHGGAAAYNKRIKATLAEIKGESHD